MQASYTSSDSSRTDGSCLHKFNSDEVSDSSKRPRTSGIFGRSIGMGSLGRNIGGTATPADQEAIHGFGSLKDVLATVVSTDHKARRLRISTTHPLLKVLLRSTNLQEIFIARNEFGNPALTYNCDGRTFRFAPRRSEVIRHVISTLLCLVLISFCTLVNR